MLEFPALVDIHREYEAQGHYYIGAYEATFSQVVTVLTSLYNPPFSPTADITDFYYGASVKSVYESIFGPFSRPTTFLIDRDGKVREKYGGVQSHESTWRGYIEELL